jgi:hypothetical protein
VLRASAEDAGLPYPAPYEEALQTWDFARYMDSLSRSSEAIEAYSSAAVTVTAPSNLWQRIGLLGKNPRAQLDLAAEAFAQADYDGTMERSEAAQATMDGASGGALRNVLIASAVLVVGGVVAAFFLRQSPPEEAPALEHAGEDTPESAPPKAPEGGSGIAVHTTNRAYVWGPSHAPRGSGWREAGGGKRREEPGDGAGDEGSAEAADLAQG